MNFVILSEKKWNENLIKDISESIGYDWVHIKDKNDFTFENLTKLNPEKIFIPHYSFIIPEAIFNKFECIVFHMTDLPFGRGGSPLQNLIQRGIYHTKISALKVSNEIDAGPIYLKKDLALYGSAEEIYIRANKIIYEMIIDIIKNNLEPIEQKGEVTVFKRRKQEESCINELNDINKIYDYIRMLDAEGYPKAFLDFNDIRIEFNRAQLKSNNSIIADVRIFKK